MRQIRKILFFAFLLCFFLGASAKTYYLEKAELNYKILPNAMIEAKEKISFDFRDSFTFAYRDIPKGAWKIENISVSDITNGTPMQLKTEVFGNGNDTRIKWHYSAANEKKIFQINYTLSNALTAYSDVAEFYWKVWGKGWEKPLKEIYGEIELPVAVQDPKDVYSWGHPELNGKIGLLENKKLIFQAFNVPAMQWVEIRIAFPRSLLQSTDFAIVQNNAGLQKIIEEEKNYSEKPSFAGALAGFTIIPFAVFFLFFAVIILSTFFKGLQKIAIALFLLLWGTPFAIMLFFLAAKDTVTIITFAVIETVVFALVWHFFGREPKTEIPSVYEREPPADYSPAIVYSLLHQAIKKPPAEQMAGELLHLCLLGKLQLNRISKPKIFGIFSQDEYEITVKNADVSDLPESEAMVLGEIVNAARVKLKGFILKQETEDTETPNAISMKEFSEYLKYNKRESLAFFKNWQKSVNEEAKRLGFFSEKSGILPFAIGTAIIAIAAIFFSVVAAIIVAIEAIALFFVFPDAMPNRTVLGAEHYEKWMRLKKFLEDFSSLKTVPPESIVLWEKYLVYAIPLGVAEKVQNAMGEAFKNFRRECRGTIFTPASYAGFSAASFGSMTGAMTGAFSSAFASASGTSGSGGFGGGGSGGGGGGGGGAG